MRFALVLGLAASRAGAVTCTTPPAFAGLTSASAANLSTCTISLNWAAATPSCAGAITYSVYRSTTPGFTPGPSNRVAQGIVGTSYSDGINLAENSVVEYVVRAVETAGSTTEDANTVRRSSAPGGPVVATSTVYFDDFDGNRPPNPTAYWVPDTEGTALNVVDCHYQSPSHSYRLGARDTLCDSFYPASLEAGVVLGGNGSVAAIDGFDLTWALTASLSFRRWYGLEDQFDYAYLDYSTTSAGGPWTLARSWTGFDQPDDGSWSLQTVDLAGLLGHRVWFRFRLVTDSIVEFQGGGFYLDDVKIEKSTAGCTTISNATALEIVDQPSDAIAGETIAPAVTVKLVDADGAVVSGAANPVTIGIANNPAGGTLSGSLLAAPSSGIGAFDDLSIERAASGYTLTASSPGLSGAESDPFAIVPAAPQGLAVAQQPSSIAAGEAMTPPPAIEIVDVFGNRTASTQAVNLGFAANPGGGTLLGSSWQSSVGGLATFSGLSIDRVGSGYALSASATGLGEVTLGTFDVTPGAPHHTAFVQPPTQAVAGMAIAPPVSLAIRDAFDNLCTDDTQQMSLQLFDNPGGASLAGATVTAVGGVASFPDLAVSAPGVGYTLFGGASGLLGAISSSFDVLDTAIFADGFESGSTAAWSATEPPVLVASFASTPRDDLAARAVLAPRLLARLNGSPRPLLVAVGADGAQLVRVEVRRAAGGAGFELRALAAAAAGARATAWIDLDGAAATSAVIEIEWWRSSPGAANGRLVLLADGRELATLEDLPDPGAGVAAVWAPEPLSLDQ